MLIEIYFQIINEEPGTPAASRALKGLEFELYSLDNQVSYLETVVKNGQLEDIRVYYKDNSWISLNEFLKKHFS